jgi:hypothetical protein
MHDRVVRELIPAVKEHRLVAASADKEDRPLHPIVKTGCDPAIKESSLMVDL